ncbi:hypothetical protein BGZ93_009106 [Podila epicladia]|nr:hypothetical protein BGZ92_010473 [Podila epicladia]KAG0090882.1 hypothetical protein BGZ93_009106 [Podila epicladia]
MAKTSRTSGASSKGKKVTRKPVSSTSRSKKPTATSSTSKSNRSATTKETSSSSSSKKLISKSGSSTTNNNRTRVLSDDEPEAVNSGEDNEEATEDESDPEDHDRQLGLRPTLRVVSKATVQRSWKPISVKSRSHIQTLVNDLFPAAINRARGEKRKISVQMKLSRMMQKMNDRLSELKVPPSGRNGVPTYAHLPALNRDLEAKLVPDLEHIRNLELRLEQEQKLLEDEEAQLAAFEESKRALDIRTNQLHRSKLHPLLKESGLSEKMASLCRSRNDFSHLDVADQRLLSMMPLNNEGFADAELKESTYNPDQDLKINKLSKRLGMRLSAIEDNGQGLDPLIQLVLTAKEKVRGLGMDQSH